MLFVVLVQLIEFVKGGYRFLSKDNNPFSYYCKVQADRASALVTQIFFYPEQVFYVILAN